MKSLIKNKLKDSLFSREFRTKHLKESSQDPSKDSKLHYLDGSIDVLEELLKETFIPKVPKGRL